MLRDICEESCELIQQLSEWYFSNKHEKIEEMTKYLAEDILVIGTGKHEIYNNVREFITGLEKDQKEADGIDFLVEKKWFEAKQIDERMCIVYGVVEAREANIENKKIIIDMDTRLTALIHREPDGRLLIDSLHHSVPYMYQGEGEYYPRTFADRAEEALRRSEILERDVQLDSMTGLYNRRYTEEHIRNLLEEKKMSGCLLLLDLDEFKKVNDSHGHQAGDRLLKHVARLLHEKSGKNDIAGRAGGDEFMLFLVNVKERTDAERTAQEIIAETGRFCLELNLHQSCSVGMAEVSGSNITFDEAYSRADKALYEAKEAGKGICCWYK